MSKICSTLGTQMLCWAVFVLMHTDKEVNHLCNWINQSPSWKFHLERHSLKTAQSESRGWIGDVKEEKHFYSKWAARRGNLLLSGFLKLLLLLFWGWNTFFIFFPNIGNLLKYQVSYLIQQNVSIATNERWLLLSLEMVHPLSVAANARLNNRWVHLRCFSVCIWTFLTN